MLITSKQTWFHSFLLAHRYGWLRQLLLAMLMFLFSFAEMGYHYDAAGHGALPLALLCGAGTLCKLVPINVLIQIVIPRLLPRGRYPLFWSITVGSIFASILMQHWAESAIYRFYDIPFWRLQSGSLSIHFYLLDLLVQFAQWFIVLMGLSMGYLLKYWTTETQHKQQMEAEHLQMEAELLKEQVSPTLLYETLHQSGELAKNHPDRASERLMLLSRLLRYQLYDCRRKDVLLDSEIKFLRDYLALMALNGECREGKLSVSGTSMGLFVPPLLFVSLVQPPFAEQVSLSLIVTDRQLTFRVVGSRHCRQENKVRRRLEQLYPRRYQLDILPQDLSLTLQLHNDETA